MAFAQICEAAKLYPLTHVTNYPSGPPEGDVRWQQKFSARVKRTACLLERPELLGRSGGGCGTRFAKCTWSVSRPHPVVCPFFSQSFFYGLHELTHRDLMNTGSVWKGGPILGTEARRRAPPRFISHTAQCIVSQCRRFGN